MRVVRRKPGIDISVKNTIRISMIAAAANADLAGWSNYVGDCLMEFAFEDIDKV